MTKPEDKTKYVVFMDYNGRAFRWGTFKGLGAAKRHAREMVRLRNCGERLTCRVYKQVYFVREPKFK